MRHYFLLTNPSTGGEIQFIFYWNWMMTVFSLHTSTTLHLTIFGIWGNNIQSVQCVICVMIVRGLWYIGLAIRWGASQLFTERGLNLQLILHVKYASKYSRLMILLETCLQAWIKWKFKLCVYIISQSSFYELHPTIIGHSYMNGLQPVRYVHGYDDVIK